MNYSNLTHQYYAHWLSEDPAFFPCSAGLRVSFSPLRDIPQPGYPAPFHLYIWQDAQRTLLSYGNKTQPYIGSLLKDLSTGKSPSQAIEAAFSRAPAHTLKFLYTESELIPTRARTLTAADADAYLAFFRAANPACADTSWVPEYFADMAASGYCCGVFDNDLLVSCTDAPDMPFLSDSVQEIGINTLPAYRGKSCATEAAALCAANIVRSGKCPLWSCSADNAASAAVARKVGFIPLADVFSLTL